MSNAPSSAPQGVTSELDAYREPAGGNYVAYLDELERRQLAHLAAAQPRLADALTSAPADRGRGTRGKPLTAAERDALLVRLDAARRTVGKLGTGQIVAAAIGLMLLLTTLVGEGNVLTLLIGIALLWGPIRRLLRGLREPEPAPNRALIDTRFGKPDKTR